MRVDFGRQKKKKVPFKKIEEKKYFRSKKETKKRNSYYTQKGIIQKDH